MGCQLEALCSRQLIVESSQHLENETSREFLGRQLEQLLAQLEQPLLQLEKTRLAQLLVLEQASIEVQRLSARVLLH